ncbi:uncharacterized protein [Lolium perenne]|uniref:uncharacterized protein n=1 Tax=Lolium perenne TaxID=4522 RepID=UPI0021F5BBF7|nr:uncharacterized protein LOC127330107 [Lolium perenne]
MARLLLLCLVSSHLAVTAVMARQFPVDSGARAITADAPSAAAGYRLHVHSLLESFAGSPLGSAHHAPHRHNPFDSHFAGGKIILGGLAAAIITSVFCYIRITRAKKITEPKT